MKVAQPDLILVQMSPEFLLNDLELQPEKFNYDTNEWKYSSQKYVDQLIRPGFELYPSLKSKLKIAKLLRQQGIIVAHKNNRMEQELGDVNERIVAY